ncbi:hypothetical protein BC830DRAFT_1170248 [Chytriomyces sp. MP71]|nr:hypothetical protein BC830DRAFT_1170248 [Chytriomyces sp. MP71]
MADLAKLGRKIVSVGHAATECPAALECLPERFHAELDSLLRDTQKALARVNEENAELEQQLRHASLGSYISALDGHGKASNGVAQLDALHPQTLAAKQLPSSTKAASVVTASLERTEKRASAENLASVSPRKRSKHVVESGPECDPQSPLTAASPTRFNRIWMANRPRPCSPSTATSTTLDNFDHSQGQNEAAFGGGAAQARSGSSAERGPPRCVRPMRSPRPMRHECIAHCHWPPSSAPWFPAIPARDHRHRLPGIGMLSEARWTPRPSKKNVREAKNPQKKEVEEGEEELEYGVAPPPVYIAASIFPSFPDLASEMRQLIANSVYLYFQDEDVDPGICVVNLASEGSPSFTTYYVPRELAERYSRSGFMTSYINASLVAFDRIPRPWWIHEDILIA